MSRTIDGLTFDECEGLWNIDDGLVYQWDKTLYEAYEGAICTFVGKVGKHSAYDFALHGFYGIKRNALLAQLASHEQELATHQAAIDALKKELAENA
jgi:hypothetical protein